MHGFAASMSLCGQGAFFYYMRPALYDLFSARKKSISLRQNQLLHLAQDSLLLRLSPARCGGAAGASRQRALDGSYGGGPAKGAFRVLPAGLDPRPALLLP